MLALYCMVPVILSSALEGTCDLISATRHAKALTEFHTKPLPVFAMAEFEIGSSARPSTPPQRAGLSNLELTPEQIKRIEINRLRGAHWSLYVRA